jgi:hypothetical protein
MTVLEEARHTQIIIEHDPLLYEDAAGMIDLASQAISDVSKEAAVMLYSPGTDPFLEDLNRNADRVFYFDERARAEPKLISKAYPWAQKSQRTLGAFYGPILQSVLVVANERKSWKRVEPRFKAIIGLSGNFCRWPPRSLAFWVRGWKIK